MRIIDPPSGWKYGFPKPISDEVKDIKKWLIENGYPQEEIDEYGEHFYCRYWDDVPKLGNEDVPKLGDSENQLTKEKTYTEEQLMEAIALYLEGQSFPEIIQSLKQPKQ